MDQNGQDAARSAPNGNGHGLGELACALAKAQAAFPKFVKEHTAEVESKRTGQTFSYKYGDLASLIEVVRKPLSDNGLAYVQLMEVVGEGHHVLLTRLLHISGAYLDSRYAIASHEKPQDMGSEITYARRYTLSAMLGVAAEADDDGAAAQKATSVKPWQRAAPPKSNAPAEVVGQPDRPSGTDPAATAKDARALFATPGEEAERATFIKELKRLKTKLKLTDTQTAEYGNTYLGAGVAVVTADLPDLALLVDFLRNRAGEPKYGAEPQSA